MDDEVVRVGQLKEFLEKFDDNDKVMVSVARRGGTITEKWTTTRVFVMHDKPDRYCVLQHNKDDL